MISSNFFKGYIRLKIWSKKSLERGYGGRTFPQKGLPPIITYKAAILSTHLMPSGHLFYRYTVLAIGQHYLANHTPIMFFSASLAICVSRSAKRVGSGMWLSLSVSFMASSHAVSREILFPTEINTGLTFL